MTLLTVGIGDCKVSRNPADTLAAHALGSCIAVILYDPVAKVAGLLHYMLPESSLDADKAVSSPFLFADTGIPLLLQRAAKLGVAKSRSIIMAAGGAQMLDPDGTFNIGQRNCLAMTKMLGKAGIAVHSEEIGGTNSRSVRIDVSTGRVLLRTSAGGEQTTFLRTQKTGTGDVLQPHRRR